MSEKLYERCDIRHNTCRVHEGVSTPQLSIPNIGAYCDDYVDAMHQELHIQILNVHYLNAHEAIFDEDKEELRKSVIKNNCKFCKEGSA